MEHPRAVAAAASSHAIGGKPLVRGDAQGPLLCADVGLRVCPRSLCDLAEFSHHEADGGQVQEGERFAGAAFPVFRETAAPVEPGDGALDDPTLGKEFEALRGVGAFDDLHFDVPADAAQSILENWPLVSTIGIEFEQKRMEAKQRRHEEDTAVTVLNIRRMDHGVHQQALRVNQNMALLSLDLLARIIAVRVDRDPPFSALFTL